MGRVKLVSLKLEHLWSLTVIAGIMIFVNTHPIRPHDFWWHITIGREILETQTIPTVDEYSYTMYGDPYPSYKMFWLPEVYLYTLYNLGGAALIVFTQGLIITASYSIIVYLTYLRTRSWRIAAIGGIFAAILGINDWNVRPQSITFLLGSICLWAIYTYRENNNRKYLFTLPISMLVWVNSHGTFPIGLVIIGVWFFEALVIYIRKIGNINSNVINFRYSAVAMVVSSLVILLNPRGIGIVDYLSTMSSDPSVQNLVVEWAPPSINSWYGGLFYACVIILAIFMIISPRKPSLFDILTYLIFAFLGIMTSRGVIWFGLILAPVFGQQLQSVISQLNFKFSTIETQDSRVMNRIISGCLFLLVIVTLPWFKDRLPLPPTKAGLISSETPIQATDYLINHELPAEVFHAMPFGSYMIWAGQPNYRVFVDSRIELYTSKIWQDYLKISNAQNGWKLLLSEYGVNTLMLSPSDQARLISEIKASGQWHLVYEDNAAVIFLRKDSVIRNPADN